MTRLLRITFISLTASVLLLSGCNRPAAETNVVPRRTAYPRIALYPAAYRTVTLGKISFDINASAELTDVTADRAGHWFNIVYPGYNARVFCTLTEATGDKLSKVLDNRTERMALNTGGAYTEVLDFIPETPRNFTAQMLVTPAEAVTPIQFVASNGTDAVMSGAMIFGGAGMPNPDSIAPIISAVQADMTRLLKSITQK